MDLNNFYEFPDSIQHEIICMVMFLSALKKSNLAFSDLDGSLYVSVIINHEPCWETCFIYDIPDEEFLQNPISLLSKSNFIWSISINACVNTFVYRLIIFIKHPSLHPHESFDALTIAHIVS